MTSTVVPTAANALLLRAQAESGWVLIGPPHENWRLVPIQRWPQLRAFDTAGECQAALDRFKKESEQVFPPASPGHSMVNAVRCVPASVYFAR
jgi:hypothetical protein